MKVSMREREGLFKELSVEVEGDIVSSILEEVYKNLRESVSIEGFRKGTAPMWIIKARYKDYIQEEVGKRVADRTLPSAIEESKLKPVADIYLEEVKLEEAVPKVIYRVAFETPPEFELKELEGLQVEVKKVEFDEELVKKRIEQLREEHAIWQPVEREIREGDLVSVDYYIEEMESGESTQGETSGIVGQRMFREEIDTALVGRKEGEEVTFEDLTLYDTEGKEAGKAKVRLIIKSVKEKVLPEIGDDFAKELGIAQTWQEAEEKIRQEVKDSVERIKRALVEESVAKKLVEMFEFDIPQTLLAREVSHLVEIRARELSQYGIDTKYLNYKSMAEELMPQAMFNIKLRYILEKYAKEKGLQVSEEDLQKKYQEIAQQYGRSVEEIKEYFRSQNMENVLFEDVLREKAFNDIISKAVIKEVEEKKDEQGD
ncbi:trigger factor [Hydrogenobacter thermophilus TK-6]|uniref:Trigger factor n=1 Tax=Hydrogenobacter thermophilus (strain DSM 6534 / IAM 12695 / TK-6) TaxID=608538 RepID=D3DHC8_HYDTT|nr:trigger factor [Hydrogenobacter thermophilus]ADO45168.1 trigger factor [Hydrogenobacter thermophilus TK-6]BAI69230.1 trigger factor [Hydrogenobacter thermophilus TK-6]